MRHIDVVPGLRLRFAHRDEAFDEGVEIGLLAASMAAGVAEFTTTMASNTLEQARALAAGLGYRLHVVATADDRVEVMVLTGRRRPKLRLVRGDADARFTA